MAPPLPNLRYERKFLAKGQSLASVRAIIRLHPAMFREAYPERIINNVYLDSPGRHNYLEHVDGSTNRIKTRIRWYGELSGHHERPVLEQKIKRGQVSGKVSHPLPAIYVNGGISPRDLRAALGHAGLPEPLRLGLRQLEPALVNRYRRHYFESADRRFRLTVDADLQFYKIQQATGSLIRLAPRPMPVILELKYAPHDAEDAVLVSNALPLRLTRCSKYVLGIEHLHDLPAGL